jgi:hypothetical protein
MIDTSCLPDWATNALENIDAGFFSGDTFDGERAMAVVEQYMARWTRAIAQIREFNATNPEQAE